MPYLGRDKSVSSLRVRLTAALTRINAADGRLPFKAVSAGSRVAHATHQDLIPVNVPRPGRSDNMSAFAPRHRTVNPSPPRHRPRRTGRDERRLRRDITVVLVIKLVAIAVLWSLFVHPDRVTVDSHGVGANALGETLAEPLLPPPSPHHDQ